MESNMVYCERRAMVVLDVPWLFHSTKNLEGAKIDYQKLMHFLIEDLEINCVRAVAFVLDTRSEDQEDSAFEAFVRRLKEVPLEVALIRPRPNKSDCNVPIATECMYFKDKMDLLVLATGNGDFCYLVERLKDIGINTVLLTHDNACSRELKDKAIDVVEITSAMCLQESVA